jgi:hypothetical protein
MPSISYTLTRDDAEIELEIDYTVAPLDPGTPPSLSYPGDPPSGGEIEDLFIAGPDGAEFTPTAAELEQIERHIYATHDYYEEPDYD